MLDNREPENIGFPWDRQWNSHRMRWIFFIYGKEEAKVQAFAKELAPEGFRVKTMKYSPPDRMTMLILTKLATYKEEELHAVIRRLKELCKRKGLQYDSMDVADPRHDDVSVN